MTCQCECNESRAKLEGLVATLRVMQASLNVLGEQIDHMLVAAQKEQDRVAHAEEPQAESELNSLVDEELHAEVCDRDDIEEPEFESADEGAQTVSDSDAVPPAPIIGFSIPDAPTCEMAPELDYAPEEPEAQMAYFAPTSSDTIDDMEPSDALEADVSIVEPVGADVEESIEMHEAAAVGPTREVDPVAKAMAEAETIQMIHPDGAAAVETETETEAETELEAEAPAEPKEELESIEVENTEAPVEDDTMAQIAEGAEKVVDLASRRRRIYRRLAASILLALVVAGAVVATRVEALDGLTSLALAKGLH